VAKANLVVVKADPTAEDMALAQAQVREAEAALAAVEVQLAKQTLTAPRDGLITQKLVNSGELATPGAVLLELSDIETVDLTVYIPETRIGQVKIGQKALVNVDAYDDEQIEGAVSFIAHEAEFTPRNVQTQEERVNLVFAVKISLDNADHRLKPGMPADAQILTTSRPRHYSKAQSSTPLPQATIKPTATP
jgi:RND family efflux transporter MFP subunit